MTEHTTDQPSQESAPTDRPAGASPTSPTSETNPASTETATDPLAELTAKLALAEAAASAAKDEWLRAKAETDTIRRRSAEEVLKAQKFGVEKIADALLAVKDSMDAALATENASVESFKQGIELTSRQLSSVFEKFSIQEINPVGQKFDPAQHQAITMLESNQEPNTVVNVMQKGYRLHERILRPALVAVAR